MTPAITPGQVGYLAGNAHYHSASAESTAHADERVFQVHVRRG